MSVAAVRSCMERRALLTAALASSAGALAGCVSRVAGPGGADGEPDGTENTTTTDGTAESGGTRLVDTSFEVLGVDCGVETSEATVTRDADAGEVRVEGTLTGSSPCYTASLADAAYGADLDALWVAVVTERRPDAGVCAQCLAEIRYRLTASFEGGLPARVAVTHDGALACERDPSATG